MAFLEYDVLVAFTCPQCENRTYPFSSFAMYSNIMAKKPFDEHKNYEISFGQFDLKGT